MILTEASVTGQRTVRAGGKKEQSGGGGEGIAMQPKHRLMNS